MNWKEFHKIKKEKIEMLIPSYINELEEDGILKNAMIYSLKAGGKRLRPFLCIMVAHLLGKEEQTVYPYACALEFIHTYSLIHDDLPAMDDDDMRRGKPSSHKQFGEDIAILAGDTLLNDAFTLILSKGQGNLAKGGSYLARAAGGKGMVLGQIKDCKIPEEDRTKEVLDNINLYKTGRLIQASLAGAAAWLDADDATINLLEKYATHIGLAFQIADDILDITADEVELGKPVGSDAELNKVTYPSLLGLEEAKEAAKQHIVQGKELLHQLPQNEFRDMLIDFSDYIVERTH